MQSIHQIPLAPCRSWFHVQPPALSALILCPGNTCQLFQCYWVNCCFLKTSQQLSLVSPHSINQHYFKSLLTLISLTLDFSLDSSGLPEPSLGEKLKPQIALSDELCEAWLILVKQHTYYFHTAVNYSSYNCSIISSCPEPFLPPDGNSYLLQHYKMFEEMM